MNCGLGTVWQSFLCQSGYHQDLFPLPSYTRIISRMCWQLCESLIISIALSVLVCLPHIPCHVNNNLGVVRPSLMDVVRSRRLARAAPSDNHAAPRSQVPAATGFQYHRRSVEVGHTQRNKRLSAYCISITFHRRPYPQLKQQSDSCHASRVNKRHHYRRA